MSKRAFVIAFLGVLGTTGMVRAELGDPTRPPNMGEIAITDVGVDSSSPGFELTSILVSPGRQVAIVNGSRVEVGDDVSGASIIEILPHAVRLESGEEEIELRILGKPVKIAANHDPEKAE